MRIRRATPVRIALSVAVAGAVTVGLTACDQFLPDPVAFTVIDGTPVVRVCIPLTITEVSITTVPEGQGAGESWVARGSDYFRAGTEFALDAAPEGFTVIEHTEIDLTGTSTYVEIEVDSARGGSWSTFSPIDASALKEGVWLDGYGSPTEVPCLREECSPMATCFNEWPIPTGYPTEPQSTYVPTVPAVTAGP